MILDGRSTGTSDTGSTVHFSIAIGYPIRIYRTEVQGFFRVRARLALRGGFPHVRFYQVVEHGTAAACGGVPSFSSLVSMARKPAS